MDAVRWALQAYLAPDQAEQAAALWQPIGAGQSSLAGLSRYCRQVAQRFNLQGREAELHLHIIRALQRPPAEWAAAPAPLVAPVASAITLPAADVRVVQAVLQSMERHVSRLLGPAFLAVRWRQTVGRELSRSRLSKVAQQQALAWLHGQAASLEGEWPARGAGTSLINAAYVALAEWLGPVQADVCLTRIVRECEQAADEALHRVRMYL